MAALVQHASSRLATLTHASVASPLRGLAKKAAGKKKEAAEVMAEPATLSADFVNGLNIMKVLRELVSEPVTTACGSCVVDMRGTSACWFSASAGRGWRALYGVVVCGGTLSSLVLVWCVEHAWR